MRIGIFGGTFNPIHKGHVHMARAFYRELGLDRLLVIPTHVPVHKMAGNLISGEERMQLCRLAVRDDPNFEVSGIEVESEEKSYTYTTVKKLRALYSTAEFFLIMGSDMFLSFHTWYHYRDILQQVTLCAAARKDKEQNNLAACARQLTEEGGRCIVLDLDVIEISSTQLREKIRRGEDVSGYLDPEVERHIREKRLYQNGT